MRYFIHRTRFMHYRLNAGVAEFLCTGEWQISLTYAPEDLLSDFFQEIDPI